MKVVRKWMKIYKIYIILYIETCRSYSKCKKIMFHIEMIRHNKSLYFYKDKKVCMRNFSGPILHSIIAEPISVVGFAMSRLINWIYQISHNSRMASYSSWGSLWRDLSRPVPDVNYTNLLRPKKQRFSSLKIVSSSKNVHNLILYLLCYNMI